MLCRRDVVCVMLCVVRSHSCAELGRGGLWFLVSAKMPLVQLSRFLFLTQLHISHPNEHLLHVPRWGNAFLLQLCTALVSCQTFKVPNELRELWQSLCKHLSRQFSQVHVAATEPTDVQELSNAEHIAADCL